MNPQGTQPLPGSPGWFIGCAGWTIPKTSQELLSAEGSHLQRYSERLPAVEINSSFYRPHRKTTYARWRATVPEHFRFSVKMPKQITHEKRLKLEGDLFQAFVDQVAGLEEKLGCLLIQLPPSLAFDEPVADQFFSTVRSKTSTMLACEPRHPSWFETAADSLLKHYRVARVAADPAVVPAAAKPGGSTDSVYYRLHGSPRMYYSAYDQAYLEGLVEQLTRDRALRRDVWCIFDNTALGSAFENAMTVAASCPHTTESV